MDTLCTLIPSTEWRLVQARVARLSHDAIRASRYHSRQPKREMYRRISTVVASIAPWLPHDRLLLLVRYAVWSVQLDDRIDRRGADAATLNRLRNAVTSAIAGNATGEPLFDDLAMIVKQLSTYDSSGAVLSRFGTALKEAVSTGIAHAVLGKAVFKGTARPPTKEDYLDVAASTVNYRSFAYALLAVVVGDLPESALDQLDAALSHGAHAVRLSNDLRSADRDQTEQTLNVLSLQDSDGNPVTQRQVRQEIGRCLCAHHDVLSRLAGPDLVVPAYSLARSLELSIGLYRLADLR
ncbi:MAG TPA: hypothetical protein DGG94_05645 [Micromonosporaceae bacterium]|nr:hypothetical protein [Micromonosporaceae bacterium]HCU49283.1 hypothetical protein [Micromonosporaceae bacterium]